MNQSTQVTDDKFFYVVDRLQGKFCRNPFLSFNESILIIAELIQQNLNLLLVILHENWFHELVDFYLLFFHQSYQSSPLSLVNKINLFLLAFTEAIIPFEKISFVLELLPKLFTPLCQNSHDGWTPDRNRFVFNLVLCERLGVLRYFPSDQVRCVSFDFLFVLFFGLSFCTFLCFIFFVCLFLLIFSILRFFSFVFIHLIFFLKLISILW